MLKVRVIPCLDVKEGRVVKGVNFVDLVDAGDPVAAARAYDTAGADELCFLDIAASLENRGTLLDLVSQTAEQCFMPLTIGGGVRTPEDVRALLLAGADKVSFNTAAVADPGVVSASAEKFGDQCIVVAIDARTVAPGRWEIFTHGGSRATGIDAVAFARDMAARGAGEIVLTSMDRDGTRAGYNLALTRAVADAVEIPVIASGGVGTLAHLVEGVTEGHASAVLAASIFHFGQHSIGEAKAAMAAAGKARGPRFEIFTHGGREPTGIEATGYAREVVALGAGEILLTSMDRDGTKRGFDLELTRAVADAVSVPVIASGGVGTLEHLVEGVREGHASAVLAASIFHYGECTIGAAKRFMAAAGLPIRLD